MQVVRGLKLRVLRQRDQYALLLLITASFLGNYFHWPLFFDIDFLFGSIAVWMVVCLYGVQLGTLAGLVAGSCTYVIWHHPYTTLTFTLEALVVGWLFHRRQQPNIVLLDALFWLLLGLPLAWLFYAIVLQVDPAQTQIILCKQAVNGIFNALIASLLLTHLPIHRWIGRPPAMHSLSLQQTLFNLLVAFATVPTLILLLLASHRVVDQIKEIARSDLNDASRYITVEVRVWSEQRLAALQGLANLPASDLVSETALRQGIQFAQTTFPDIQQIQVVDAVGNPIGASETLAPIAEARLNGKRYLEQLRRSSQPILVQLVPPTHRVASPKLILGIPRMQAGTLVGAVVSQIDLDSMTTLLKANAANQALQITLVDAQQAVVTSTQTDWNGQQRFDWRHNGQVTAIDPEVYHWLPSTGSPLVMVKWTNSLFVKESTISRDLPWKLVVHLPAKRLVQQIEQANTQNMAILLLFSGIALVAAVWVSRRLVQPVAQLAEVTTNLPHKLLEQEPILWTQSQITEFALLVQNVRSMSASLQQKFGEIHQANETLEQRVQERTQALQQSNAALQESEVRFRQMAENIREVFWMGTVNKDQLLYISPAYEEIWGRTCDSLYANPFSFVEAMHPDDQARILAAFEQQSGGDYSEEYRIIRPDGSMRWIWDQAFPIYNEAGVVYRLVGVAQDITDRKQAEIMVRQQAERERLLGGIASRMRQSLELDEILNTTVAEVRQFLQTDRVIVYQFQSDWSGVVVMESVAPGWQSILGMYITDTYFAETGGELYKQGRIQATADVYTAGLAACHLELLVQLQVRANLVVPIVQGHALWGLLIAQHCSTPRLWQPSEIDFLKQLATQAAIALQQAGLYHHEQRLNFILEQQVEERTAQLQQALRYEAMVKRMTDKVRDSLDETQILQTAVEELVRGLGVYGCDTALFDLEQNTLTVSHAYTNDLLAPHPEIILANNFSDIYAQLLQAQSLQFCELVPQFMDPGWQSRTIFACPIVSDQDVLGLLRLFRDQEEVFSEAEARVVSQVVNQCAIAVRQARLYQAAQVQVRALEELNQMKDEFLSTVSHELRTPIANMKMAIHLLKTITTAERRDRYMEILQTQCDREAELINDLLDLQRVASGTQVLELERIHIPTWLDELLEPFRERAQNRQQTLQIQIAPNLPDLRSDRTCLNRILAELLNNACKYTPPGETITLAIQTGALPPPTHLAANQALANCRFRTEDCVQICVCNSGIEIPAVELLRIFEKFYRIPGVDRWKQGGTGLGLALVQKLTEHLGGSIRAESQANRTCFIVEL